MFGGSLLRDMEDDPFFRSHNDMISNMMAGFNSPFQSMFPAIGMGPDMQQSRRDPGRQRGQNMMALQPHGMFGMFGQMDSMFANMQQQFTEMASNPNVHTYSSSSVMSYTNDGSGAPKVYQASSSTRRAPGGIRETRKAVRDSESGTSRLAIGHHIGDRSHVIERSKNMRNGDEEEKQDFINLDEDDADYFDREWRSRTNASVAGITYHQGRPEYERQARPAPKAITATSHRDRHAPHPTQNHDEQYISSVRGRHYERNGDWDANDRRSHKREQKVRVNSRPTYH